MMSNIIALHLMLLVYGNAAAEPVLDSQLSNVTVVCRQAFPRYPSSLFRTPQARWLWSRAPDTVWWSPRNSRPSSWHRRNTEPTIRLARSRTRRALPLGAPIQTQATLTCMYFHFGIRLICMYIITRFSAFKEYYFSPRQWQTTSVFQFRRKMSSCFVMAEVWWFCGIGKLEWQESRAVAGKDAMPTYYLPHSIGNLGLIPLEEDGAFLPSGSERL